MNSEHTTNSNRHRPWRQQKHQNTISD